MSHYFVERSWTNYLVPMPVICSNYGQWICQNYMIYMMWLCSRHVVNVSALRATKYFVRPNWISRTGLQQDCWFGSGWRWIFCKWILPFVILFIMIFVAIFQIYWGDELRLKRTVEPLDYTPDQKKVHRGPITPDDVIDYCLSTIGATSYGEIYNIHATVVDQNFEKHPQRTCQKLAIELAKMFSSAGWCWILCW